MEILAKLLGGTARVKIMRLFLFNPDRVYSLADVANRSRVSSKAARKEITFLNNLGFVRQTKIEEASERKKGSKKYTARKKVTGWHYDKSFEFGRPLYDLLLDTTFVDHQELLKRFNGGGKYKLFIVAGIFIKNEDSRIDIFIVGDQLKRPLIERALKDIEAEIGKELRYAVLETEEFNYRLDMYDKFVRDVLDYPHERLIEKMKVE